MHLVIFLAILLATLRMSTAQTCDDGKEAQGECECGAPTKKCTKGQICELAAQTCKQPPQNGNAQQGGQNGNAPAAPLRCQDKNGSFLPSATICTDKLGSDICSKIFDAGASGGGANSSGPTKACVGGTPEPADCTCGSAPCKQNDTCDLKAGQCTAKGRRKKRQASGGDKRPEKCDLPELTDYARQCAKTCKICCETVEHGCEDNPAFYVECQNVKFNCKVPDLASTMAIACPRTCGLCGVGDCKDTAPGCDSMKGACQDYVLRSYVGQHCQRTCKICTPGSGGLSAPTSNCVNTGVDCDRYAREGWCQGIPERENSMRIWCRKSCGFC